MKALEKPELDELEEEEEEEGVEEEKAESDNEFGSPKLSPDIEKPGTYPVPCLKLLSIPNPICILLAP